MKSKVSVKNYVGLLDRFKDFVSIEMNANLDYDGLSSIPKNQLQILVEDYIMIIKKKVSPNSVPMYYQPIQAFFETNEIDLKWKKIKRLFPGKVKVSGDEPYTTRDIEKMLACTTQLRNKAIIHFLASTGCRLGALAQVCLKHLKSMNFGCKSVLVYEDSIEEYHTFLIPEAVQALDAYLGQRIADGEKINEKSPLFRNTYLIGSAPVIQMNEKNIQNVVSRVVSKSGIRGEIQRNGRYAKQTDHAFRKRFNTILKLNNDVNSNVVEKLLGHKNGLDGVYLKPTIDELFKEFQKAIPELTIDGTARKQAELDIVNDEKSQLEKINKTNELRLQKLEEWAEEQSKNNQKGQEKYVNVLENSIK